MSSRKFQLFLGLLVLNCWLPAHAYIDPGTGSAIIQGLVATIAAAGVMLRLYWHNFVTFIGRHKSAKSAPPAQSDSPDA